MSGALLVVGGRPWSGVPLAGDAVLVQGERIAAVGARDRLAALAPDALVLDAAGGTVTPGLVDAHLHLVPWAQARRQLELGGARTRAAALAAVAEALVARHDDDDTPLVGRGWDDDGWEAAPERAALDLLAPSRPLLLHRHDFHALWVNSAALRAAGITRATPDPEGGRFDRDAAGEPTGLVREHAVRAFHALEERAGPAPDAALLDEAARALHVEGITGVHDFQRNAVDGQRMLALSRRRRLRVLQHVGPEQVRAASDGSRGGDGDAWFRTGALKLFADGTLGSRTASMLEPYDDAPGRGMALLAPDALAEAVSEAAAHGFSVAIHAIGDAAVRHSLDAIEAHREEVGALPLPPRIEHVQLVHVDDVPRFAALGVAASMQPQHAYTDAPVARRAWGRRCRTAYAWRALLEAGAPLAFGSDAPVEPPRAALGLACAVARLTADGQPFEPGQALPLDAALAAYTSGAARLAAGGLGRGTLEPGEPADLVIWDRDLHRTTPAELASAGPRFTVLAGEIVYDSR